MTEKEYMAVMNTVRKGRLTEEMRQFIREAWIRDREKLIIKEEEEEKDDEDV